MSQSCKEPSRPHIPWLTLAAAAVGVSAAAWMIYSKTRMVTDNGQPEDLIDLCERAAAQLDARLHGDFPIAATS